MGALIMVGMTLFVLYAKLDKQDVLWIWFERYRSETEIEKHAEALPKYNVKWFSDHNPEYIRKLRKGGHLVKKANKQIITGIDAVNARIRTGRLKVLRKRCPALFAEAESYVYPEKDEIVIGDKPVDEDNHAMDALRYLVMGIDGKKAA